MIVSKAIVLEFHSFLMQNVTFTRKIDESENKEEMNMIDSLVPEVGRLVPEETKSKAF